MNFYMGKRFLQYGAKKKHLSEIVGVESIFLLKNNSLRRWIGAIFLVLNPKTLPINKKLVIGV